MNYTYCTRVWTYQKRKQQCPSTSTVSCKTCPAFCQPGWVVKFDSTRQQSRFYTSLQSTATDRTEPRVSLKPNPRTLTTIDDHTKPIPMWECKCPGLSWRRHAGNTRHTLIDFTASYCLAFVVILSVELLVGLTQNIACTMLSAILCMNKH